MKSKISQKQNAQWIDETVRDMREWGCNKVADLLLEMKEELLE